MGGWVLTSPQLWRRRWREGLSKLDSVNDQVRELLKQNTFKNNYNPGAGRRRTKISMILFMFTSHPFLLTRDSACPRVHNEFKMGKKLSRRHGGSFSLQHDCCKAHGMHTEYSRCVQTWLYFLRRVTSQSSAIQEKTTKGRKEKSLIKCDDVEVKDSGSASCLRKTSFVHMIFSVWKQIPLRKSNLEYGKGVNGTEVQIWLHEKEAEKHVLTENR